MSSSLIGNLPPPYPNAAQALSKVATNVELRAQIKESSDKDQVKPSDESNAGSSSDNPSGQNTSGKSSVDVKV